MKGIMFELLAGIVEAEHGPDAWDDALDRAEASGAYTSLGTYDDAEFVALIVEVAAARAEPVPDAIRWFGRSALPVLVERYPAFTQGHVHARSFLLTLNQVIHPEVRKVYPGAQVPDFVYEQRGPAALALEYRSDRALCTLAEGLILGSGDHFGEDLAVTQSRCVHRGDDRCILEITGLRTDGS